MGTILLYLSLSCPPTLLEDLTDLKWTDIDQISFEFAKQRCPEIFPEAPCLIRFSKREFQVYHAVCGLPTFTGS